MIYLSAIANSKTAQTAQKYYSKKLLENFINPSCETFYPLDL